MKGESERKAVVAQALETIERLQARLEVAERAQSEPIAVVGAGCRFPGGASGPDAFWRLLHDGVDAIGEVPASRWDAEALSDPDPDAPGKSVSRHGGFLDGIDEFDPQFFGISPREARSVDPQQRLLLEVSWEALEHAGIPPDTLLGTRTGVFVGITNSDYRELQTRLGDLSSSDVYRMSGTALNAAPGRVSFALGLHGPAIAVDTACSSSLVAVHLACRSLRSGESVLALAGGVNVILSPQWMVAASRGRMLAPDGRCKTFDARADGFVRGEGCGLVVLKRLSDALADDDPVLAVIRGTAVNQDGATSGFTVPNKHAQEEVVRAALADAGVDPLDVSYVEAHGTGTSLGDPIEVRALADALCRGRPAERPLALGSVKTNVGHLESAAGIAGLLKVVLALQHCEIPQHLHLREPTPHVDWASLPIVVPTERTAWIDGERPRLAGVSSFGASGTNAHVVVEAPAARELLPLPPARPLETLCVSARSEEALREAAIRYAELLRADDAPPFRDVVHAAATGRQHLEHRLAVISGTAVEASERLERFADGDEPQGAVSGTVREAAGRGVAFLFTGQGAQRTGMGRELYETEPVFREVLDECADLVHGTLDVSLLDVLYPAPGASSPIDQTAYAQPALVAVEVALARLWRAWGIEPTAVIGHSVGEIAAACVAGALELDEAMRLVVERGRLMQALPAGGAMASVLAAPDVVAEVLAQLDGRVVVAAENAPDSQVVSGPEPDVESAISALESAGARVRRLNVSHAFHSSLLDPMLDSFEAFARTIPARPTRIPFVANVTGSPLPPGTTLDAAYWRRAAREPVRFAAGIEWLLGAGHELFLECGPAPTLAELGRRAGAEQAVWLASLRPARGEKEQVLASLAELHVRGVAVDWDGIEHDYPRARRRHLGLPTQPFRRERHWLAATPRWDASDGDGGHPILGRRVRLAARDQAVFEAELAPDRPGFLADHRVAGSVVVPAAALLEAALAAAPALLGPGRHAVEGLALLELLAVPETGRIVQLLLRAEAEGTASFELAALEDDGEGFRLHAAGRLRSEAGEPLAPLALDEIAGRCADELDVEAFYEGLTERGVELGPSFRGIEWLRVGPGEALAQLALPPAAGDAAAFGIHPALLDACLQAVGALLPSGSGSWVPAAVERLRLAGSVPANGACVAHATLRPGAREAVVADIRVADRTGAAFLEIDGLAVRPLAGRDREPDGWLYEVSWQDVGRPDARPGVDIEAVAEQVETIATDVARADDAREFATLLPELEALSAGYVERALLELGWTPAPGERATAAELAARLGVLERHGRLFGRLLAILAEEGIVESEGDSWVALRPLAEPAVEAMLASLLDRHPRCGSELEMTARCGSALGAALRGEADALELLFPGGSLEEARRLYRDSPFARPANALVAGALGAVAAGFPDGAGLRVLEVGGGTGGTTAQALAALGDRVVDYLFTDVSPLFVAQAAEELGGHGALRTGVFDVEIDAAAQGLALGSFDVVLAANVLHATRDLRATLANVRSLLAPGGALLLLEGTRPYRFGDLIVGLTEGWWLFDDDVRGTYALLDPDRWCDVLRESGFAQARAVTSREGEPLAHQAVILANVPGVGADATGGWVLIGGPDDLGSKVRDALERGGDACRLVRDPDELERELDTAAADGPLRGVVYLQGLDTRVRDDESAHALPAALAGGIDSLLGTARTLATRTAASPLWLVTRGAEATGGETTPVSPDQTALRGLGRAIADELPELSCRCIDLDPDGEHAVEALVAELQAPDREDAVALRGTARLAPRLVRAGTTEAPEPVAGDASRPWRLTASPDGTLDRLHLAPVERRTPGPGEVEIAVRAIGLGFRDVLLGLGMYPGGAQLLGSECAGTVAAVGDGVTGLAVGDEVVAVAPGSFGSHVVAPEALVVRRPAVLSPEEAATIPSAFLTARWAFERLAGLRPGETVLVHAAAGGVGMAALRLALRVGATVIGTAGTPAKRALVRALGASHCLSSRTPDFAEEVRRLTGGRGVDVVLNSLAGEFIEQSVLSLAPDGRFVEIGRRDVWSASDVAGLRPDARYDVLDLAAEAGRDPDAVGSLLAETLSDLAAGRLEPLPRRVYPLEDVRSAFRAMAHGAHIGKVVVSVEPDAAGVAIRPDVSYLVTGGLGGLGLAVASWLVERGARAVALAGRSEPSTAATDAIERMRAAGARIDVLRADVGDPGDVEQVLATIDAELPPLRGIVHAAGTLDDGVLLQQTWSRFETVLAPKAYGAWNLHVATTGRALDFFALFSSAVSLLGSPGQANHVAASASLDGLAHRRRTLGLPAASIDWGPWSGVGAAAERGVAEVARARGLGAMSPAEGVAAFARALQLTARPGGPAQIGALQVDWRAYGAAAAGAPSPFLAGLARRSPAPSRAARRTQVSVADLSVVPAPRRRAVLLDAVRGRAARVLGLEANGLDPGRPLNELGLDSLMAVELRNELTVDLGLERPLSPTLVFDYPTVVAIAEHLVATLFDENGGAPQDSGERRRDALAADLEDLSDAEAEALLLAELGLLEVEGSDA